MKLTPKQDKFCLHYHENGNAYEAYRHAYNAENMKRNTIDRKAYGLLQKDLIRARLDQLNAESQAQVQYRQADAFRELCTAVDMAYKAGNPSAAVQAIKAKIDLLGLAAPKRKDVTTDGMPLNVPQSLTVEFVDPPEDVD